MEETNLLMKITFEMSLLFYIKIIQKNQCFGIKPKFKFYL